MYWTRVHKECPVVTHQKVIDRLVSLGLTTYEARVFSALTRLGEAGVGEIHSVSEVPRSAVYGALEKLERRGVVETSTGRPKRFRALPPKVAVAKIESSLMWAVKDATEGLEELAREPHMDRSDVRIWVLKGGAKVRDKLEEISSSVKSDLFVAGTPDHMMAFSDIWLKAKSRRVKMVFGTMEPEKISELSKYGVILRPKYHVRMPDGDIPKILFVRADRRVILFASEYKDETRVEDITAFWTDDEPLVRFLNYLTDALSSPRKKGKDSGQRRSS